LPAHVRQIKKEESLVSGEFEASQKPLFGTDNKWLSLAELEAEYVARVLTHTGGNKQAAARILRIDRKNAGAHY
jgi:DNA-binding NtrC family response regulator